MFRLEEDFTPFYAAIAGETQLNWATSGAGRLLASPTVFEDVVKTICTTNCAWSATRRMMSAIAAPERKAARNGSFDRAMLQTLRRFRRFGVLADAHSRLASQLARHCDA